MQRMTHGYKRLTLAQRFMLTSLVVLLGGLLGVGLWVAHEIQGGVVQRTAATTALYVDSLIAPPLQDLAKQPRLSLPAVRRLNWLLRDTPLGQEIATFKVWDGQGRIVYSTTEQNVGQVFAVEGGLANAWHGVVAAEISDLAAPENIMERQSATRLLEIYSPVRLQGTNQVIAVAEFYYAMDELEANIRAAQRRSWLLMGAVSFGMYVLLAGFVQHTSRTILLQQTRLGEQVRQLTAVLAQNDALNDRVRRAAAHTTALHERGLRRISAELHDGPIQDLGLALLRLDHIVPTATARQQGTSSDDGRDHEVIGTALRHALNEIRAISSGLGLPQLEQLSLGQTVERVVHHHRRRTGTTVVVELRDLPDYASLPLKITVYRVIQEALTNAYRHAGAAGQQVAVAYSSGTLTITVRDEGPGMEARAIDDRAQLGLVGMRERVESLGGRFVLESAVGQGTTIIVRLPLELGEAGHEQ